MDTHSRRQILTGLAAAGLACGAMPAMAAVPPQYAPLMRRAMKMRWIGQSRTKDSQFENGEFYTDIGFVMRLEDDWSFSGEAMATGAVNNQKYTGTADIWGMCWVRGDDAGISITRSSYTFIHGLPDNMKFDTFTAELQFMNDPKQPGRFALAGHIINDRTKVRSWTVLYGSE